MVSAVELALICDSVPVYLIWTKVNIHCPKSTQEPGGSCLRYLEEATAACVVTGLSSEGHNEASSQQSSTSKNVSPGNNRPNMDMVAVT